MGLQQIEGRYDQGKFDPVELIKQFNQQGVWYILIGRQAVVQYGAPLFSLDYDFWVLPEDRKKTYLIIESMGLVAKYKYTDKKPLDIFSDDYGNKVDVFL